VRVTGTADFVDAEGNVIETKTDFSLCRCGASKEKPFCDGSHRDAGFVAD
jgi:CDGSH-type Zn-finger protein